MEISRKMYFIGRNQHLPGNSLSWWGGRGVFSPQVPLRELQASKSQLSSQEWCPSTPFSPRPRPRRRLCGVRRTSSRCTRWSSSCCPWSVQEGRQRSRRRSRNSLCMTSNHERSNNSSRRGRNNIRPPDRGCNSSNNVQTAKGGYMYPPRRSDRRTRLQRGRQRPRRATRR